MAGLSEGLKVGAAVSSIFFVGLASGVWLAVLAQAIGG